MTQGNKNYISDEALHHLPTDIEASAVLALLRCDAGSRRASSGGSFGYEERPLLRRLDVRQVQGQEGKVKGQREGSRSCPHSIEMREATAASEFVKGKVGKFGTIDAICELDDCLNMVVWRFLTCAEPFIHAYLPLKVFMLQACHHLAMHATSPSITEPNVDQNQL